MKGLLEGTEESASLAVLVMKRLLSFVLASGNIALDRLAVGVVRRITLTNFDLCAINLKSSSSYIMRLVDVHR